MRINIDEIKHAVSFAILKAIPAKNKHHCKVSTHAVVFNLFKKYGEARALQIYRIALRYKILVPNNMVNSRFNEFLYDDGFGVGGFE